MSTKTSTDLIESAGGARNEPVRGAQRPAGGEQLELPDAVHDRLADEVIDELLAGARTEEEIVGPGGVLAQLTKRLVERAMSAELTEHLGYEPHREPPGGSGNTRNGSTAKTLATEHGPVRIERPRDRNAASSRRSSGRTSGASRGPTTRSSRSTRAGCRPATSRRLVEDLDDREPTGAQRLEQAIAAQLREAHDPAQLQLRADLWGAAANDAQVRKRLSAATARQRNA